MKKLKRIPKEVAKKYFNLLEKQINDESEIISLFKNYWNENTSIEEATNYMTIEEEMVKEKTGNTLDDILKDLKEYYIVNDANDFVQLFEDLRREMGEKSN